jgi:general secretion pathway protein G
MKKKIFLFSLILIFFVVIVVTLFVPKVTYIKEPRPVREAQIILEEIRKTIESFRFDCKYYPASDTDMKWLLEKPADCAEWHGPYLEIYPISDPWGRNYVYENANGVIRILSHGQDGRPDGSDDIVVEVENSNRH